MDKMPSEWSTHNFNKYDVYYNEIRHYLFIESNTKIIATHFCCFLRIHIMCTSTLNQSKLIG